MRQFAHAVVLALVVAGSAVAATPTSGLRGVVSRGPIAPVCTAEQPCSAPFAHAVLVFSRSAREVARTTADGSGHYRIALAPGLYAVRVARGGRLEPSPVRVRAGAFARVDFDVDTGIR